MLRRLKIVKKFENAVGEKLAVHYYIKGPDGGAKKIDLGRSLIIGLA